MPVLSPVARGMAKDRLEDDPTRSPADRTAVTRAVRALARAAVRRRERGETHREHWDLSRPRQPGPAAEPTLAAVRQCLRLYRRMVARAANVFHQLLGRKDYSPARFWRIRKVTAGAAAKGREGRKSAGERPG